MREAALRRNILIVWIVVVVLAALTTLIMKLRFFDAINTTITATNTEYNSAAATAAQLNDAVIARQIAENNRDFAKAETNTLRQRFRSLTFDLGTTPGSTPNARDITWRRYLNEYYTEYGTELRRELLQAADESGVVIRTAVKVQAPPQNPEDVQTPPGGFLKPLTDQNLSIEVAGKLPDIIRFFNRINQSEILMTTGQGFTLENNPLGVRATFSATPYLVASGPDALLPAGAAPAPATGDAGTSPVPAPTSPGA